MRVGHTRGLPLFPLFLPWYLAKSKLWLYYYFIHDSNIHCTQYASNFIATAPHLSEAQWAVMLYSGWAHLPAFNAEDRKGKNLRFVVVITQVLLYNIKILNDTPCELVIWSAYSVENLPLLTRLNAGFAIDIKA